MKSIRLVDIMSHFETDIPLIFSQGEYKK